MAEMVENSSQHWSHADLNAVAVYLAISGPTEIQMLRARRTACTASPIAIAPLSSARKRDSVTAGQRKSGSR
jgi:hypothetical protein